MKRFVAALASLLTVGAVHATGDGHRHEDRTAIVVREHRDREAVALLVGAAVGYWIAHRRHRSRASTADCALPPRDEPRERALRECLAK